MNCLDTVGGDDDHRDMSRNHRCWCLEVSPCSGQCHKSQMSERHFFAGHPVEWCGTLWN